MVFQIRGRWIWTDSSFSFFANPSLDPPHWGSVETILLRAEENHWMPDAICQLISHSGAHVRPRVISQTRDSCFNMLRNIYCNSCWRASLQTAADFPEALLSSKTTTKHDISLPVWRILLSWPWLKVREQFCCRRGQALNTCN